MLKIPPDWGTFCVLIVSFIVFWFIFRRLLFDPFLKVLAERERKLKTLSERAEQLVHGGKAADEEYANQLAAVRREGLAERETRRRQVEEETNKLLEEARGAARESMERVQVQIERQLQAAERELGELGENLAVQLAERVLGRPVKGGPQVHSQN